MGRPSHAHRAAGNYGLGRTDSIPPEWSEKASAKITFDLGLEGIETGRVGGRGMSKFQAQMLSLLGTCEGWRGPSG